MTTYRATLLIGLAVIIFTAGSAMATGKRQCAEDYRRFCSQWGLETRGLENCMRRHGDQLSKRCIKGLISAGAVSQAEVDRRRAALGR
jgi:ribosomal protein L13